MPNTIATRAADWPTWATTGDKTRPPTDGYLALGWPQTLDPPPRQYWNWAMNELFNGVRYGLQRGIPAYAATESYAVGAVVEYGGLHYKCTAPAINFIPTNGAYWERWAMTLAEQTAAINAAVSGITAVYATDAEVTAAIAAAIAPYSTTAQMNSAISVATSGFVDTADLNSAVQAAVAGANPNLLPPGSLGTFGTYNWVTFLATRNFTVPAGVTSGRIRLAGGGGGAGTGFGGSGAGYAHGVFALTPGAVHTVTIGAGGAVNTAGGSTSFGALISATGGGGNGGTVGAGTGGDFQASGGLGGTTGGGGASGSQRGNGGAGTNSGGGGAVGGISYSTSNSGGASPFGLSTFSQDGGPDMYGTVARYVSAQTGANGLSNVGMLPIRFPFDGFTGGGGAAVGGSTAGYLGGAGGPGAGGGWGNVMTGGDGGDGGGGGSSPGAAGIGGRGGYGAGGGHGLATNGVGGQGFCVLEY